MPVGQARPVYKACTGKSMSLQKGVWIFYITSIGQKNYVRPSLNLQIINSNGNRQQDLSTFEASTIKALMFVYPLSNIFAYFSNSYSKIGQ